MLTESYKHKLQKLSGIEEPEVNESLISKIKSKFSYDKIKETLSKLKQESRETKEAAIILAKWIKGDDVSPEETKALKDQSVDLAKLLGMFGVFMVPGGSIVLPAAIAAGKKFGVDIMPSSFKKGALIKEMDNIEVDGETLDKSDEDAIPFMKYEGVMYVGDIGDSHVDVIYHQMGDYESSEEADDDYGNMLAVGDLISGRVWVSRKVISFWNMPDEGELSEIIEEINSSLHPGQIDSSWRIYDYRTEDVVPIDKFIDAETSKEIEAKQKAKQDAHMESPLEKKPVDVNDWNRFYAKGFDRLQELAGINPKPED